MLSPRISFAKKTYTYLILFNNKYIIGVGGGISVEYVYFTRPYTRTTILFYFILVIKNFIK